VASSPRPASVCSEIRRSRPRPHATLPSTTFAAKRPFHRLAPYKTLQTAAADRQARDWRSDDALLSAVTVTCNTRLRSDAKVGLLSTRSVVVTTSNAASALAKIGRHGTLQRWARKVNGRRSHPVDLCERRRPHRRGPDCSVKRTVQHARRGKLQRHYEQGESPSCPMIRWPFGRARRSQAACGAVTD